MEWEFIGPMVASATLFLSVAAVLIFRPLTKRLGELIDVTSRNKQAQLSQQELGRVTELVERLADRLERLEERQDFAERMLSTLERPTERPRLDQSAK